MKEETNSFKRVTPDSPLIEKMQEIPEPVGSFIIKNCANAQMGLDGAYYHYSQVCVLLGKYSNEQNDIVVDLLGECRLQLEYLSQKFGETGTGNNLLSRINTFLNSVDKVKENGKE